MKEIKPQYGFPLFVKQRSTDYLLKAEKTRVSDIWALWHYIIKTEKKRFPGSTDYVFLVSVLEQAQYFYEAAALAPIKSKPLLFYYSFLNLAKAAIVLNDSSLLTGNLEFNHGVDICPISNTTQLGDCYITIKNLLPSSGFRRKISVTYELARIFEDSIEFKRPHPISHDNGPWKISIISLLKSCIGIHRTVSETYKSSESYIHVENPRLEKDGRNLIYRGNINASPSIRSLLIQAGYNLEEIDSKWTLAERYLMATQYLTRADFHNFSIKLLKTGLWTYTTGNDFRVYINPNHLIKDVANGIYQFDTYDKGQPNIQQITLSSATVIYCIMFFLGSITRYHPFLFEKVLTDKEIWTVSEFLKTQPLQFVLLLTSRVLGKPLFTSRMP